jgi:hypothetical protein
LARQLNIKSVEDWYKPHVGDYMRKNRRDKKTFHFASSIVSKALQYLPIVYPDHQWQLWRLHHVPIGYWQNETHQKEFLDWALKELGYEKLDDWYGVDASDLAKIGGGASLMSIYRDNLCKVLMTVYHEHDWKPWKFKYMPKLYWEDVKNQRSYLELLAKDMEVFKPEDWYKVKTSNGFAPGFLKKYTSHIVGLQSVFPEYNWQMWRFDKVPRMYWDNEGNVRAYMQWFADKMNIHVLEDWKKVTTTQLYLSRGKTLLCKYKGIRPLLDMAFPQLEFQLGEAEKNNKSQAFLLKQTQHLFPEAAIQMNYRHPELIYSTGYRMELDVFIPSLAIALEYQGQQHYTWHYLIGSPEEQIEKDQEKRIACQRVGISLIEVPYWWNFKAESLAPIIRNHRPGNATFFADDPTEYADVLADWKATTPLE